MSLTNPIPHSRIATIGNISSCNCNKRKTKVTQHAHVSLQATLLFQARISPDFIAFDCSDQINKADIRAQTVPASAKCEYTLEAGGEGALVELANYALARSAIIFSPENICLRRLSGVTLFLHHYSFIIHPPTLLAFLHSSILFSTSYHLQRLGSRICFILSHRHTQWVNVQHQPEYGW